MNQGQVLITFDDGLLCHTDAAIELKHRKLKGTFGIVTSKVNEVGFLSLAALNEMSYQGHFICNHSHEHLWSGVGATKPGISANTQEKITKDYTNAREWLNKLGFNGDYLLVPFGTTNINGPAHMDSLLKIFKWIRVTIGAALPLQLGGWTIDGGKRLYPKNYSSPLIGISAAADARMPGDVEEKVKNASDCGSLVVLLYHSVCDIVGETQNVTWKRFISDLDFIEKQVNKGHIQCITPDQLVGG